MKKLLSMLCALALTLSLIPAALAAEPAVLTAGGWYETIRAELTNVTDEQVTAVSYTPEDGEPIALTGEDFKYLVRDMDGGVRIDIPGVEAGTYTLTVTQEGGKVHTAEGIKVAAYDRSGFAHKVHTTDDEGNITGIEDYAEGVGAYNNDGTLKKNAIVLYVTEENKETVTLTHGFTVTGIGNILNTKGWDKKQSDRNQRKLLQKVSQDGLPIVVRILGKVTKPEGTTTAWSTENGGSKDDGGGMCIMEYVGNITIEGIGPDATVDGWGFCFSADGTGRTALNKTVPLCAKREGQGENIEVRNLTFRNVPEDCIGITGAQDTTYGFKDSAEHVWVHNNSFYGPKELPDQSKDQDKSEGDGAVDFRNGEYMTMSYNYFYEYHKTSLIGSGDDNLQYHVTWHHNWWKNVESRAPLCRQADVHIYNNLFDGQTSYCMSLRANCFIFSEYNTFLNCKNPVVDEGSGGVCKSYQDLFSNCNAQKPNAAKQVTDRAVTVTSNCKYANFDTDAKLSYIPSGSYALETDTTAAVEDIHANSGVMKSGGLTVAETLATGKLDNALDWRYTADDTLTVTGAVPEEEKILVGCYDAEGCLTDVALITKDALKARLEEGAATIKLFWLDTQTQPKCQAVNAWGEEQ